MKDKYRQWITLICAILLIFNIGSAGAKYVTTINNDVALQVQAAGYTLICHPQGGTIDGSTADWSKTQFGNTTFATPTAVPEGMVNTTFLGWAFTPDATKVDVEKGESIVVTEDITHMYAIWGFHMNFETNYDSGMGDLTAIDENNMVIDLTTNTGTYERIFIPLEGFDPNYCYRISFDYSGSGNYHHYTRESGGGRGFFGYNIINENDETRYQSTVEPLTFHPDGFNHFIDEAGPDQSFNLQNVHYEDIFVPTSAKMYLYLEYSDVEDFTLSYHYINNLKIEKLDPKENCAAVKHVGGSTSKYDNYIRADGGYYSFRTVSAKSQYERFGFAIPRQFEIGKTYTVSFDFSNTARSGNYASSQFGFAVDSDNSCLNTSAANAYKGTFNALAMNAKGSYSHTFTAAAETMYMLYEISKAVDGNTADYAITNFRIEEADTYDLLPDEAELPKINLDYTGISSELEWRPIENELVYEILGYEGVNAQFPYANFDYTLCFEPYEGYVLDEMITVVIDGEIYEIPTDGSGNVEGEPGFDPDTGQLMIPAVLLIEDTKYIVIIVDTVSTEVETESESELETESETEFETESETEFETESETELETESETELETESETEFETESKTELETESETEFETESETELETESETESVTESETESATESETESATEPETESATEPETESATEPETESATEPETESATEPETEFATKSETEFETESEPKRESESESEMELKSEPKPVMELELESESELESEPAIEAESEEESEFEEEAEEETESEMEPTMELSNS